MALEQLLASLTRDAEAAVAALLDDARTEAESTRTAADEARRRRLADAIAARRRGLEARLEEDVVEAGREASRAVLRVREDVLARVLARARKCLALRTGDPRARAAAAALVSEATPYLGGAAGTVRCHPDLAAALAPVAARTRLLVVEDVMLGPGAVLSRDDGELDVDATLEQLLLRRWPDEAIRLAAHLEAIR